MNEGEIHYKDYLEKIKEITNSGTKGTSVKDKLKELKNNYIKYANSTNIDKKFDYKNPVGNQDDTELAFYNFRTENPSDLDLTRKLNHYEINKDDINKVDYSIFLFPIKEFPMKVGIKKKVVSTSIFFPQTMIFNGKGFNYVTGIIKAVETFKARMGEGWIYRIYYDSMIDLYSNEYETQLKEFIETKFPNSNVASHYNTQFVENESKGCHKNVRDMMRLLRNFFEYIKRNSYYDFVELYAFDAPLTRMFPYLDKHILYEDNEKRFSNKKFRPYIGHPQTFGSMMRFFPLFDDEVEKVFFVNSSHSITPILAHFIKKWENEPYLCIPCWQTWTSNPSCIDTMQYQLKTIIFLLCGEAFYGTGTSLTSHYKRVTNIIKEEEFESNIGGQPTITRVYDMNFGSSNTSRANSGSSGSSGAAAGPVPNQDTEIPKSIKDFLKGIGIVQEEIGITKDTDYLVYLLEGKSALKTPVRIDNGTGTGTGVSSAAPSAHQPPTFNTEILINYLKGNKLQSKTFINVIKGDALNEILRTSSGVSEISYKNFKVDLTYNTTRDYNRIYENLRLLLVHTGYKHLEEIKTTNGKLFTASIMFNKVGIENILNAPILPESTDANAVTQRKRKYEIEIIQLQSQIRRVTGKKYNESQGQQMEVFNEQSNDPYIRSRQEKIKRIDGYKKLPSSPEFWYGDNLKLINLYKRMFIINLLEILVKKYCGLNLPTLNVLQGVHSIKQTLGNEKYRYQNINVDYGRKLKDFDLDDLYSLCSFRSLIDLSIVYDENFVILDDIAERIKKINLPKEGTKSLQLHSILILEDYEIIKFFLDIKNEDLNFDEYIDDFFNERNRFIDFLCEFSVEKFNYLKDHSDNKKHNLEETFSITEKTATVLEKKTSVYNSPYYDNLGIPPQPKYFFDSHDLPYIDFKICRLFAGLTGVNLKAAKFRGEKQIRETKFLECCGYINNFTYSIDELILTLVLIPEIQQEKSFLEEKKKWMKFYIKQETQKLFTNKGMTGHRLQTELFVKSMANYVAYLQKNQNINPNTDLLQHFTNFTPEEFNLIAGIVGDNEADEPGRSVTGVPTRYQNPVFGHPPPMAMEFHFRDFPSSPPLGLPVDPLFALEVEEPYETENPEYIFRNILDIGEREGHLFMDEHYIDIFMDIAIRNDDFIKPFNHLGLTKYYQTNKSPTQAVFLNTTDLKEEMCKIDLEVYAEDKKLEYLLRDDDEMVEAGIIDQDFKDMIVEKFLNYIYKEGEINLDRAAYYIASFKKTLFFTHRYIPRSFLNYGDLSNQLAIRTGNFQGTSQRINNLLPNIGVEKYIVKSGLINFLNSFDEIRPIMIVDINFSSLRELSIIIIYLLIKFKFKENIIIQEFQTIFNRVSGNLQLDNYKYIGAIPDEILNFFKIVISNDLNVNNLGEVVHNLGNQEFMEKIVEKCVKFLSLYDIHSSSKVQLSDILAAAGLIISSKSVIISKPLCLMG